MENRGQNHVSWGIIICLSSYLLLWNLKFPLLWQDEAETALVSRTVLEYGIPKGFDGINHFSQQEGREYGVDYVWKLHPWFQFYWQAAFFYLFGFSTTTARLPFALLGIATVLVFYQLALCWWGNKKTALISVLLLLGCVSFLLLARQSRYYSAAMFFGVALMWSYVRYIQGKRHALVLVAVFSFLLLHTHYVFAFTFLLGMCLESVLLARPQQKWLLPTSGLVLLFNLPFIIWLRDVPYADNYQASVIQGWDVAFSMIVDYGNFILDHIFFPFLFFIPIFLLIRNYRSQKVDTIRSVTKPYLLPALIVIVHLLTIALLSTEYYARYMCVVIPVIMLLAGQLIMELRVVHRFAPWLVAMIVLFLNPIEDFIYERHNNRKGPVLGMVAYFEENLSEQDTVAISYGDLPLKFYFDNKVYGGLTGEGLAKAVNADYIVLRHHAISKMDLKVKGYLYENVDWSNYNAVRVNVRDAPFENRETPEHHNFKPSPQYEPLLIHKRVE